MRPIASRLAALAAFACAEVPTDAFSQAEPAASFRSLVSSNGFAPVVYDLDARRLVSFREHLYRYPEPGLETRELLFDLYLGLEVDGAAEWMTRAPLVEAGYELGTGLMRTVQKVHDLDITTTVFSPFGLEARAFAVVAEVENRGGSRAHVALASLHNFHVGAGGVRGEHIVWNAALSALVETSTISPAAVVVKPISAARPVTSPAPIYDRLATGRGLGEVATSTDSGVRDDAVSALDLSISSDGRLAAGARAQVAFVVAYAPDGDVAAVSRAIDAWVAGRGPSALLEGERANWRAWHDAGLRPIVRSEAEARVSAQSLAMLRMAQVREPGAPNGALVASLAPGKWDIAWVRDGMYAIDALVRSGHVAEAEAGLEFALRGPFGEYETYVGRPYGLSVARYFGNGREESDWNERGPNIELDGFGLFLETFSRVAAARTDGALYRRHRATIDALIADVLVGFRDPETGLIAADSSIWESHWDGGGRQRWTFTSGAAVRGLDAWAERIALEDGRDDPKVSVYRSAADQIRAAMARYLVAPTGAMAASAEQLRRGVDYADAQAALILGAPRFDPASRVGRATLDLLHRTLFLGSTTACGYKRNDDGDLYDQREWVVIDLAMARAFRAAGREAEADALVDWVTGLGAANFGILPELLDQNDARYAGEVPMIGFGAGAYVTSLIERSGTEKPLEPPPSTEDGGVVGREPDSAAEAITDAALPGPDAGSLEIAGEPREIDESCGCTSAARRPRSSLALASWLAVLLVRRRTSRAPR